MLNPNYDIQTQGLTTATPVPVIPTTSITSASIAPAPTVQLPPTPQSQDNSGFVNGATTSIQAQGEAILANMEKMKTEQAAQQQTNPLTDLMKQFTDASQSNYNSLGTGADRYASLETQAGIDAKTQAANAAAQAQQVEQGKLDALNASLQGKNYEFNTVIPNQMQQDASGRGITQGGLAPLTAAAQRKKLLEIAPLQLQVLSQQAAVANAQGNTALAQGILQNAQTHIDKLYQIQSQDAQTLYQFKSDQIKAIYQFATESEKRRLDGIQHQNDQAHADQMASLQNASAISSAAMNSGQADIAAKITALDPKSPTYNKEVAALQSQIKLSEAARLDLQLKKLQISKAQKEISLLGAQTKEEKKAAAEALKSAKSAVPEMQDKIALVDTLKNNDGMAARVGASRMARQGSLIGIPGTPFQLGSSPNAMLSEAKGQGQDFAAGVHNLTGGLTLQNLIDAKARGATFGALSEGELRLLAASATKLTDWEIKDDKGNGTGYWNIDEASFNKELDFIKEKTQRALQLSGQSLFSADEQAIIDEIGSPQFKVADYFKK